LAINNLVAFIIWKSTITPKRALHSIEQPKPLLLKTLLSHPYLKAIFICCVTASICTAIEVYQLFFIASQTLSSEQAVGTFMGKLFGYIGIAQLLINFVLARWLFAYIGILNVMLILPVLFILLGFGFTLYPLLLFASGMKFIDAGLSGTLGNMVTQILLLPLPERIRMHSQAILTGLMGTTARVIGGVILILFSLSTLPIRYYSIVIILAAIVWLVNAFKLILLYKKEAYKKW
jgi:ATP/ADP translocase